MITSKYNIIIKDGKENWIFNSASGCALRLTERELDIQEMTEETKAILSDHGFLVESNVSELGNVQANFEKSKYALNSLSVTITPTLGCNFSCYYCFEKKTSLFKSKKTMDVETQLSVKNYIIANLKGRNSLFIRWFGGEPLLDPSAIQTISEDLIIICNLAGIRYDSVIQTNGYLLTEDNIKLLKSCKVSQIAITMDGNKVDHDFVRFDKKGGSSYDQILKNIERVVDIPIIVRINVTKRNFNSVFTLIDDLTLLNTDTRRISIYFSAVYNYFNGNSNANAKSAVGYSSVSEYAKDELELYRHLYSYNCHEFSWSFLHPINLPCSALKVDGLMIDVGGDIIKCDNEFGVPEKYLGNVETGISNIQGLRSWMSQSPKDNPYCPSCELLPTCLGNCGSLRQVVDPVEACPSKKFNYKGLMEIGIKGLKDVPGTTVCEGIQIYKGTNSQPKNMVKCD